MVGDSFDGSKKSNKSVAEAGADLRVAARAARQNSLGHYLLNPHVPGPLSELYGLYRRRVSASRHEAPILSGLGPPVVALVNGGEAGKEQLQKKASLKAAIAKTLEDPKVRKTLIRAAKITAAATGAGVALYAGTSVMDKSKESNKASAERLAKQIKDAKDVRINNTAAYILNPTSYGPLGEATGRLFRRHYASMAEHPLRSSLIPFYGMVRGGEAGKDKV